MKKKLMLLIAIFAIGVLMFGMLGSGAWFSDTSTTRMSMSAASLDFKLNGDNDSSLELNLGEVMPGNSGRVDLTINNEGSIPGSLCVTTSNTSPGFIIQSSNVCGVVIEPGGSTQFVIDWTLPIETHNTGLGGNFNFSFTFVLTNGYRITKNVTLKGTIVDPTDTPTTTPTETATPTPTNTLVPTEEPTVTEETPIPTLTSTSTATATNTATPTPTNTLVPTEEPTVTEETPIPTLTSTSTATATNTATETATPTPTNTLVPTEEPTVTEETPMPTLTSTSTATATNTAIADTLIPANSQ